MSYTAIRQVLQTQLAAELGIRFVGGIIDGPVEDRDIGCCWTALISHTDDVVVQVIELHARAFKQWKQDTAYGDEETKLAALEDLALQTQQALGAVKASQAVRDAGGWYIQDISEIVIDLDAVFVEATVIVVAANPFTG